jgi:hypothetical protein
VAIQEKNKKKKTETTPKNAEVIQPLVVVSGATPVPKPRIRVKEQDFMRRLTEKLTHFDATMILEAAMLSAGVARQEGFLKKDETKEICLQLIKRGGPAFSVGSGIYREVIG